MNLMSSFSKIAAEPLTWEIVCLSERLNLKVYINYDWKSIKMCIVQIKTENKFGEVKKTVISRW